MIVAASMLACLALGMADGPAVVAEVEVEEVVARPEEANNGAGPLWCYGAPLVVRAGEEVFASVMEVGRGVAPPCNTRWRVFRRREAGWELVACAEGFREREPCPIAFDGPLGLLVSVNPAVDPSGVNPIRCDPHLLRFDTKNFDARPIPVRPGWSGSPRFAPHSYRGVAADPGRGEVLVLNIDEATDAQRWALVGAEGGEARSGSIRFPIRACYPQVALRDGSGHVLALGDVVEPVEAWRNQKRARGGGDWDYVFRRLFHAEGPDLASKGFEAPMEVDNVEATGGNLRNLDLHVDRLGVAHVLYLKANTSGPIRDASFPSLKVVTTLEYAAIRRGEVVRRSTLIEGGEGAVETPQFARFHAMSDGRLLVVAAVQAPKGLEDRVMPMTALGDFGPAARIDLKAPLGTFFTATERGGSPASDTLDLFGQDPGSQDLRYARVRLR